MKTIVFWGAGKIGKCMLDFWRQFGMQPHYFADNSEVCWATCYYGIKVLSIEELKSMEEVQIIITCNQVDSIVGQLLGYGMDSRDIFKGNTINDMVIFWASHMKGRLNCDVLKEKLLKSGRSNSWRTLFDVPRGFVLGGVEAWVRQMADRLSEQGTDIGFVTIDMIEGIQGEITGKAISLKYWMDIFASCEMDRMLHCLLEIGKNIPCNVICNFPEQEFYVICLAKMLWPQEVNLIAVVHSDDHIYYKRYNQMQTVMDYCIVTCDKMEKWFIEHGMAEEKILRLAWQIPCEKIVERTYSKEGQPIRIGYAGRIVKGTKRLDILAEVAKKLKRADVDFQLEIAGVGEYEEELREILKKFEVQVCFKGYIERKNIADFWRNQDIGINCSDLEGRCISKAESMAAGAVPIITETSSARDDVRDGYNGYVVPVGDVDGFVDRICYLYHHRELLEVMGERSHQIILKQNAESNVDAMWNKILKK